VETEQVRWVKVQALVAVRVVIKRPVVAVWVALPKVQVVIASARVVVSEFHINAASPVRN